MLPLIGWHGAFSFFHGPMVEGAIRPNQLRSYLCPPSSPRSPASNLKVTPYKS